MITRKLVLNYSLLLDNIMTAPFPTNQGYAPPAYTEKASDPQMKTMIVRDPQPQPDDHLALAIFVTILCCLPMGIVGLMKSGEVKTKYSEGDFSGSLESSRAAKKWSIAGLIAGIVMWILAAVFLIVYLVLIVDQEKKKVTQETTEENGGSSDDY